MNCKFCHNKVNTDLDPTYENNHPDLNMSIGWCHKCPIPVYYEWQYPENDDIQYISISICDPNRFNDNAEKFYFFMINYDLDYTELLCFTKPLPIYESIFKVKGILDITPNNFFRKLKTYVIFS